MTDLVIEIPLLLLCLFGYGVFGFFFLSWTHRLAERMILQNVKRAEALLGRAVLQGPAGLLPAMTPRLYKFVLLGSAREFGPEAERLRRRARVVLVAGWLVTIPLLFVLRALLRG